MVCAAVEATSTAIDTIRDTGGGVVVRGHENSLLGWATTKSADTAPATVVGGSQTSHSLQLAVRTEMWDTKTFLLRLRHWQLVALHLIQFLKCHRKTACSNSCELVWTEDQFTDFVTAKNIGSPCVKLGTLAMPCRCSPSKKLDILWPIFDLFKVIQEELTIRPILCD